jgi:hypothetical protein
VTLDFTRLDGRHVRLEPFEAALKEEVRVAIDCDAEAWAIMPINPTGSGFEDYWSVACGAPQSERMAYAIRRRVDEQVAACRPTTPP